MTNFYFYYVISIEYNTPTVSSSISATCFFFYPVITVRRTLGGFLGILFRYSFCIVQHAWFFVINNNIYLYMFCINFGGL